MQTDSAASATYLASRSASECTTTVLMPSSRHARCTRNAISPRLAIRILSNGLSEGASAMRLVRPASGGRASTDHEEGLAVLHRLAVFDEDRLDAAGRVGLDLVHELHGLDDAQRVAGIHRIADLDEGLGAGRG